MDARADLPLPSAVADELGSAAVHAEREDQGKQTDVLGLSERFGAAGATLAADGVEGGSRDWDAARPGILRWAKEVAARLGETSLEVDVTVSVIAARAGSCEIVRFSKVGESDRGNVHLALRIDEQHVEVSLELDPDLRPPRRGLRAARASDPRPRLRGYESIPLRPVVAALQALPEQFAIGIAHDDHREGAHDARGGKLRDLFASGQPLWLGWSIPREVVVEHAGTLDEQLGDALVALGPLFKHLVEAPTRKTNAAKDIAGRNATPKRRQKGRRFAAEPAQRPSSPLPGSSSDPSARLGSSHELAGRRKQPPLLRRLPVRKSAFVPDVDPSVPIEKGTRVRVLSGPFVGKMGVVQELDARGVARVMLGLLATRLEVKDLIATAEVSNRRMLPSSHRKPLPTR